MGSMGQPLFFKELKVVLKKKSGLTKNRTWIKSLGNFYSIR